MEASLHVVASQGYVVAVDTLLKEHANIIDDCDELASRSALFLSARDG